MARRMALGLGLALVILVTLVLILLGSWTGKDLPEGVKMLARAPGIPPLMTVLSACGSVGRHKARELALRFGVEGEPIKIENEWKIEAKGLEVWIKTDAVVTYYDNQMMFEKRWDESEMPDEQTCILKAEEYLSRFKEWSGTDQKTVFRDVQDDGGSIYYGNGTVWNFVTNRHINFDRIVDGRRVLGTQAGTRVYLDNTASVIGFSGTFWKARACMPLPTVRVKHALSKALRKASDVAGSEIVIERIEIVYDTDAAPFFLIPSYLFVGTVISGNETRKLEVMAPAVWWV